MSAFRSGSGPERNQTHLSRNFTCPLRWGIQIFDDLCHLQPRDGYQLARYRRAASTPRTAHPHLTTERLKADHDKPTTLPEGVAEVRESRMARSATNCDANRRTWRARQVGEADRVASPCGVLLSRYTIRAMTHQHSLSQPIIHQRIRVLSQTVRWPSRQVHPIGLEYDVFTACYSPSFSCGCWFGPRWMVHQDPIRPDPWMDTRGSPLSSHPGGRCCQRTSAAGRIRRGGAPADGVSLPQPSLRLRT